eukprot:6206097-Pleurochrysis_carterae.AAC.2
MHNYIPDESTTAHRIQIHYLFSYMNVKCAPLHDVQIQYLYSYMNVKCVSLHDAKSLDREGQIKKLTQRRHLHTENEYKKTDQVTSKGSQTIREGCQDDSRPAAGWQADRLASR